MVWYKAAGLAERGLTLNAVEVNLQAWTQLLIRHTLKLLGESVDCTLERFMPPDLCFYGNGVNRFTVAGHPRRWIGWKLKQEVASAHLNVWLLVPRQEAQRTSERQQEKETTAARCVSLALPLSLNHKSQIATTHVSVSSAGSNWTEFTSPFQTMHFTSSLYSRLPQKHTTREKESKLAFNF